MANYEWFRTKPNGSLKVKQAYGIIYNYDGNVLLRVENDKFKLSGGKPEVTDLNYEETLKRELWEELNTEVDNIEYLGYLIVTDGNEQYVQLRYIGTIKNIGENRPDIDTGIMYKRFMSNQKNVKKYLNYSDAAGNKMIDEANEIANKKYKFEYSDKEYYV